MQIKSGVEIVPIFSGGGTRLSCYIGILQALKDMGFGFQHLVGVSGAAFFKLVVTIDRFKRLVFLSV